MSSKTDISGKQNFVISFIGLEKLDKIIIKKILNNYFTNKNNFFFIKKNIIRNFFFILISNFNRIEYRDIPLISDLIIFFISKDNSFTIQFYETILFLKECDNCDILLFLRMQKKKQSFIKNLNKKLIYFFEYKVNFFHSYYLNPFLFSLNAMIKILCYINRRLNEIEFKLIKKTFIIFNLYKIIRNSDKCEYLSCILFGIKNNDEKTKYIFAHDIGLFKIKNIRGNLSQRYVMLLFFYYITKNFLNSKFIKNWQGIVRIKKILISFSYRGICTAFFIKNKGDKSSFSLVKLTKSKYYLRIVKNLQFVCFLTVEKKLIYYILRKVAPLVLLKFSKINLISMFKYFSYYKKILSVIKYKKKIGKKNFPFSTLNICIDEWNIIGFVTVFNQSFINESFKIARINIKSALKKIESMNSSLLIKKKINNGIKNSKNLLIYHSIVFNISLISFFIYITQYHYFLLFDKNNTFKTIKQISKQIIGNIYSDISAIPNISYNYYYKSYTINQIALKVKINLKKFRFMKKLRFLSISQILQYMRENTTTICFYSLESYNGTYWARRGKNTAIK
uniref:Uncharacterized protein n=1 Tax=Lotharella vacuolata TaxID=74820 RepID=A0A0H5BL57_9EUKA|nr:hypothetical protein [Lotharella vacuolata]